MSKFRSLTLIALFLGIFTLTGCASQERELITIGENTVIIDVRNPAEYAGGHLEGAKLLDFNSGEFTEAIPTLDKDLDYVVYCRSGARAGKALDQLKKAGFQNVKNLGSLEEAAKATGIAIVK